MKAQHLKDAVTCRSPVAADRTLTQLTRLTNFLVAGEGFGAIMPFLAGAPLYALKKDDGGVRPIAVGEPANLVLVDPQSPWTARGEEMKFFRERGDESKETKQH